MAKLLGDGNIAGYVPKMIELRHGYIINGQYYKGEEMQAVPFCTVYNGNFTNLSYARMFLSNTVGVGSKDFLAQIGDTLFFDKFDTEVSYLYCCSNDRAYALMLKIREKNGECTIEGYDYLVCNSASSSALNIIDFIQREPDKVAFIFNEKYVGSTCKFVVVTYNTSNFTLYKKHMTNNNSYYYTSSKIDDNLYFVSGYSHLGVIRVSQDYGTENTNIASNAPSAASYYDINILNTIKSDSDEKTTYQIYYYIYGNVATTYNKHVLVTIEINKHTNAMSITSKDVTTDTTVPALVRASGFHYSYVIEGTTKKYLVDFISMHSSVNACIFTLYEILPDENLKVIKSYYIAQNVALNLLFKNNGKRVLIPSMTAANSGGTITRIAILDWNEAQEDFIVTKTIDDSIHAFGYNKNDELFVMKKDTSIDKYNDTSVAAFNATFAESYYNYQGENIATHLNCTITNLEGEQLAKKVMLELEGAAYFTDNSTKKIEFTTSTTEVTTVNITISGPGAINIYPKIEA